MNENNEQFIYILYEHGHYIGIQIFNLSNQRGRKGRKKERKKGIREFPKAQVADNAPHN